MLFPRSHFTATAVRPLIARSTCQSASRPPTSTPIRQLRTNSLVSNTTHPSVIAPTLNRFRGSLLPQSSTPGVTMLNNESRSHFHSVAAESFYPSNNQLFGEFSYTNTPSYFGSTSASLTSLSTSPPQSDSELTWEDFTLYDEEGLGGDFSWDIGGVTPALFAPLAEVFASAISNTNEGKTSDSELEQEGAFVSDEDNHSYDRQ
ncbi:hypothetical protein K7432_003046 [Basidiobolus ranarum]|uniref:Uncharacterized protein n=1 Tax=Basidiobolus ranarum TaxID=34480 RepID=A0ABR2X0L5_9FUNG